MNPKLFAILLALEPVASFAADIASVNFKTIEGDLREYYLAKPENAELKKQFETAVESEKKMHEDMQEKVRSGNRMLDLGEVMPPKGMMDRFQLQRKIETDLRKELYLIVSGLGLKYELIYDTSSEGAVIYAKSQVDDLTAVVRQAIIDLRKKPPGSPKGNLPNRGKAPGG